MGREVRRVPLDFDWPLGKVWDGYLMPEEVSLLDCPDCELGYSPNGEWLQSTFWDRGDRAGWYDKLTQPEVELLAAEGRLNRGPWGDFTYSEQYINDEGETRYRWHRNDNPAPSADEVNQRAANNGMLYDCITQNILVRYRCERLGVPHYCGTCGGSAQVGDEVLKEAHDAWEPTAPPAGDGWQVWETTSEGSPVTPVFASAERLARFIACPDRSEESQKSLVVMPYDNALRFVNAGWAPTAMSTPDGGIALGYVAVGERDE